jgi:hypothetical protein
MRVSPIGWAYNNLETVLQKAEKLKDELSSLLDYIIFINLN